MWRRKPAPKDGDGKPRLFWAAEGGPETADPGFDPHLAPDPTPLWNILDMTPEGRGTDWYPSLDYGADARRSEEHTSELPSLMRISYAVFCLKKKKIQHKHIS